MTVEMIGGPMDGATIQMRLRPPLVIFPGGEVYRYHAHRIRDGAGIYVFDPDADPVRAVTDEARERW